MSDVGRERRDDDPGMLAGEPEIRGGAVHELAMGITTTTLGTYRQWDVVVPNAGTYRATVTAEGNLALEAVETLPYHASEELQAILRAVLPGEALARLLAMAEVVRDRAVSLDDRDAPNDLLEGLKAARELRALLGLPGDNGPDEETPAK